MRRVRVVALIVLLAVLVAPVVLVLVARPALSDARDRTERTWADLQGPLVERYAALDAALGALRNAGASDRDVAGALERELERWRRLTDDGGVVARVESANRLEGLSARLRAVVAASERLRETPPLGDAVSAVFNTAPPPDALTAYNDAVREYQKTRESVWRRPVARLFDYDARPQLRLVPA